MILTIKFILAKPNRPLKNVLSNIVKMHFVFLLTKDHYMQLYKNMVSNIFI